MNFDVRSPLEYSHSRIPGAKNLPLFTDQERAAVGTCYKQVGKHEAIELGVKLVGPKLFSFLQEAQFQAQNRLCKLYCWRGGMRSGFVRNFLESVGFKAVQLQGGYKAFRRHMLLELEKPRPLVVLGGMTGSGKTELLYELERHGKTVVDLEKFASHRGSVYGEVVGVSQPSCEQFENELAFKLYQIKNETQVWVEDESRLIGAVSLPSSFFMAMRRAPLVVLESPLEERICRIVQQYGSNSKEWWIQNTLKIQKKLGGSRTDLVIRHIENGELEDAIRLLLPYYDERYSFSIQKHEGPIYQMTRKELMDANSQSFHSVCR